MVSEIDSHKRQIYFHLYEAPGVGKFIETESRMVGARGRGGGVGSYSWMTIKFQFCKMKKFWR